jgi:pimeloyl-ACP methyl ester carboxylesterase
MPRRAILIAAVLGGCLAPAQAQAGLDFKPCASPAGVQCAQIDVPIDRSGQVPGTFSLLVHRVPAPHPSGRPPLIYLTGGPGQTNTAVTVRAATRFKAALDDRDLITFAQRGTGPTSIKCAAYERGDAPSTAVPACADQLGPARNFYTSRDAADDIDAIREALGVDKIALYGASYGTWVEQGYAIRHPSHVETMVLDSTIGPSQRSDPFGVDQFKAAPELARALCHNGACSGITKDPYADVLGLFAGLNKKPLTAKVFDPSGHSRTVTLSGYAVAGLLPNLDINDHFRAALPAALAGALRKHDLAPLARLLAGGPVGPPPDKLAAINATLALATSCEEDVPPFDRSASPQDRLTQARQQLATIPPATFDPFGPDLAFLLSNVPKCVYWPMLPQQPSFGDGPPADVPVLLIHGEFDLRAPFSSTTAVAQEFPQSTVFTVPNAGHSASRRAMPNCARTAVVEYLAHGTAPPACKDGPDPFAPRPLVPRSVKAAGGVRAAARLTVSDAFEQLDVGSGGRAELESKVKGGGLRGGSFRGKSGGRLVLRRYVFVKGLPVSGTVHPHGVVTLKVPHHVLRFKPGSKLQRRTLGAALDG